MNKPGYVYLIQAGKGFRFKIGCSIDPERRIKELQGGSSEILKLLCFKKCNDMHHQEGLWHKLFISARKHGEWFDLNEKQLPKIVESLKGDIGVHFKKRTVENLIVGKRYFISWDGRKTEEVIVLRLPLKNEYPRVDIRIVKTGTEHYLYADEIRESPISALFNRVTL